jgi:hypothetical protein
MKNFLLVDFGASLMHTHHSRVIRGFIELIEGDGYQVSAYLPLGSEIAIVGKHTTHRRILVPSYHPVGFRLKHPRSWIPGFTRIVYSQTENSKWQSVVSGILSRLIVEFALLGVKGKFRKFPDSIVIFPTACPISVRLGERIKDKFSQAKLVFRLTNTAENRGYFTRYIDSTLELSKLIDSFPTDIRIGYEMKEYANSLKLSKSNLYYSPTPPCLEIEEKSIGCAKETFGFLGMAQRHKGTNWLVEIISKTLANAEADSLSWIIQTEDPPPSELLELSTRLQVKLLPGRLSESEMSWAFTNIDLVCLPYNIESYTLNASALAYRAADNLTAVATFKGSAFANEVENFGIGLVANDMETLINDISNFDTESSRDRIIEYNEIRTQSNRNLITW